MSKRDSRRKRQERQRKLEARLTAPELAQQGYRAFQRADYAGAIKAWDHARGKPNAPLTLAAALAEAHFRRAISQPSPDLSDLIRATNLRPADQRYRYHLALAFHRQGALDEAEPLYRQLLAEAPPFTRAAAPLAQLLLEQNRSATKDPAWQHLSPAERTQLAAAEALIRKKAVSTLTKLSAESLHPFWRGLVALALNDFPTAQQCLQPLANPDSALPAQARAVARYYLGVIAAAAGQIEAALAHWQVAQAGGMNRLHLQRNLSAVAYVQAIAAQQAGQPQKAADLLAQAGLDDADTSAFYRQLNLELGYAAAQKGDWKQALSHWQQAESAGDESRQLTCNLALAYQHQEQYHPAAEYWRTMLRRRPRKVGHPDALTDSQVARIWQNIAENYSKAGDYEEAIDTYKTAVKWAPDNVDLRLKLVEVYQSEGRWQAAENELQRILEKQPDSVPALTLLAECYDEGYFPDYTRQIWLRILELEPHNPVARQQLAHTYEMEGQRWSVWVGNHQKAIEVYKEGLKYVPDSQRLLVLVGGAYADWGKLEAAREYLAQARAINPDDAQTLHTILLIWLSHKSTPDVRQTLESARALSIPLPGAFFLDLFHHCFEASLEAEGEEILRFVETKYGGDDEVMVSVASAYIDLEQDDKAASILRSVLKNNPNHVGANVELGIAYYQLGQTRLAKNHWHAAEVEARRQNDPLLAHHVKLVKDSYLHGKPVPDNPLEMFMSLPPEVRANLLKDAPPEVAAMLQDMDDMDPDLRDMLFDLGGFDDEEDADYA
jgi:tetratricopeptide (TPR) repeat protein